LGNKKIFSEEGTFGNVIGLKFRSFSSEILSSLSVGDGGVFLEDEMSADVECLQHQAHVAAVPDFALVIKSCPGNPGSRLGAHTLAVNEWNCSLHDLKIKLKERMKVSVKANFIEVIIFVISNNFKLVFN
jgi:hypothetical protein